MVVFAAPLPAITTQIVLPNPQLSDSVNSSAEVEIQRAMDGTRYTFVKSKNGRRRLLLTFTISRMKALEVETFITQFHSKEWQIADHLGDVWHVNMTSNPVDLRTTLRAMFSPGNEMGDVQLEFEGFRQ